MRLSFIVLWSLSLLLAAACSTSPRYDADTACSIEAETVEQIIGTDRFTAESKELAPPEDGQLNPPGCIVEYDDNRLLVRLIVDARKTLEVARDNFSLSATPYELGDGTARVTQAGGTWICANLMVQAHLDEGPIESEDAMRSALEDIVERVGCYEAGF